PGLGRGDLDQHVGSVDDLPQVSGLCCGGLGLVGQIGVDLDGDAAVDTVACRVGRCHDVARIAYVVGGQHLDGVVQVCVACRKLPDLVVVHVLLSERSGEDRRVGRNAADGVVGHKIGKVA